MSLRLTTAITLIAAAGLVAACNEEEDTSVASTGDETVIIEEGQTETAATDGAISPDVVVPSEARVVGATGDELEAAMSTSGGTPAVEGTAEEGAATELTSAQPAENQPQSSEAEMPAAEAADAGDAVEENDEAVTAASDEVVPADEADEQAEMADADTAAEAEQPIETADADDPAEAEQPAEAAATVADAGTATGGDAAATTPEDGAATETATIAEGTDDAGVQPLTDEEIASLNLEDLDLEGGDGMERLTAYVEGSDAFDATEKTVIVAGLEAAQDDPEQMQVLFDQIKEIASNAN